MEDNFSSPPLVPSNHKKWFPSTHKGLLKPQTYPKDIEDRFNVEDFNAILNKVRSFEAPPALPSRFPFKTFVTLRKVYKSFQHTRFEKVSQACEGQTKQLEYKDFFTWWFFGTSFYHSNATGCHLNHVKKKFNKYLEKKVVVISYEWAYSHLQMDLALSLLG